MAGLNEPGLRDAHVDALLTQISLMVMNEPSAYVASGIFPRLNVRRQTGIIPKYDYRAWLADEAEVRAPGTESSGSGWTVDNTNTYICVNWAHHTDFPDEIASNEDAPYNSDRDATMFVFDKLMMRIDRLFVLNFMKSGVWMDDVDLSGQGRVQWSDTTAKPVGDLEAAQLDLGGRIAREGNRLVLSREALGGFKENADLLDRIKYTQRGQVTTDILTSLFDLARLVVPTAIYASNAQGTSLARARIWPKHSLLTYTP